jgi:hypothetical protein
MRILELIALPLCLALAASCHPISTQGGAALFPPCAAPRKPFYVVAVDDSSICGASVSSCGVDKNEAIAAAQPRLDGKGRYACDASTVNPALLCAPGDPASKLPSSCFQNGSGS